MSDLDFSLVPPGKLQDALDGPALQPPEGVVPNFKNPWNENAASLFGLVLCLIASTTFLLVRIYVRFIKLKLKHLGDYLMIPAYLCYVAVIEGSLNRIATGPGLFVHQWDERGRDMPAYLLTIHIGIILYGVSILLIKTSILIEWLHVFVPLRTRNSFYWSCYVIMGINAALYVAIIIASNLACIPYRRNWDKTVPGHCIDIKIINLVSAIINLVLDIAILILPQRVIWKLHITPQKKFGISTVFAIGVGACVAAGCRIQANVRWIRSRDMTYHFSAVALWAIAEITCGILILCVPSTPMAVSGLDLPKWVSSLNSWATSSIGKLKGTKTSTEGSWSQTNLSSSRPQPYESLNESESNVMELTNLGSARLHNQQSGIIRTTDIVATESYTFPATSKVPDGRQHPWEE